MSWPADVRAILAEVFGKKDDEKPAEQKPAPYDPSEGLRETRAHLRRLGAALGAGATALLVGLGWVQLHNVFPAPENHRLLVPIVALASSVAALIGVGWLLRLIFAAQRRVPIVSDTDTLGDLGSLSNRERRTRNAVFHSIADEHKAASLRAVELRARELERQAEGAKDPATKAALKEKAARLHRAVDQALSEAALLIVEERSGNVFRGTQPVLAFTLAALGIIVAFGVADYSKGQRDLIALRKSCAEAVAAGAEDPCESVVDFATGPTGATGQSGSTASGITIGVRRQSANCAVRVRVNGKRTRGTNAGMAKLTISDLSRYCGVQLRGGGLIVGSGWRHTGRTTAEVRLKPISYSLTMLQGRDGEVPTEPLVAIP